MLVLKKLAVILAAAGILAMLAACGSNGDSSQRSHQYQQPTGQRIQSTAYAPPKTPDRVQPAPPQYPPARQPQPPSPSPQPSPAKPASPPPPLTPASPPRRKGIRTAYLYKVLDGDTLILNVNLVVRLANIDAPEKSQKHGPAALGYLTALCSQGKPLWVEPVGLDRYDRLLANVWTSADESSVPTVENTGIESSVNHKMLENGLAHTAQVQDKYRQALYLAERKAQYHRKGVWAEDEITTPQTYRQQQSRNNR